MQEKKTQLGQLDINYKIIGEGETPVVVLHGWGVSSDKYVVMAEEILQLDEGFRFYIPDLPGFGKSDEPATDWNVEDYASFAREFVGKVARRESGFELVKSIIEGAIRNSGNRFDRRDKKVILIAHSFGGRIAIRYAARYPDDIKLLVLTGAAGIRHPLGWKKRLLRALAQAGKAVCALPGVSLIESYARKALYLFTRERDYVRASSRMKGVMRNALADDLRPILPEVKVPTVLIWGEDDRSTPLADGRLMEEKIAGSKLSVIPGANHSAVYNNAAEFAKIFIASLN